MWEDLTKLTLEWLLANFPTDSIAEQRCSKCYRYCERFSDKIQYTYCPFCGADMREEINNTEGMNE